MAAIRHPQFLKVLNFNCPQGSEDEYASASKFYLGETIAEDWLFISF